MKLAILFWCYKNLPICIDRLRHLRDQNPEVKIFVLFGGDPPLAPEWQRAMAPLVDDFYVFDGDPPPGYLETEGYRGGVYWKYVHGDWMFAAWFRERGVHLEWDTFVVIQWDMLVYGKIDEVFSCLEQDMCLFSGLRPVREVEDKWLWVAKSDSQPQVHATYQEFLAHVREKYGWDGDPMCCLAIVVCLSRAYMEKFVQIERPELGGLEYRLPVYAQAFGVPLCMNSPFEVWWAAVEPWSAGTVLRARPIELWAPKVLWNVLRKDGARVFHPYWRKAPRGVLGWAWAVIDAIPRGLVSVVVRAVIGNRQLKVTKRKVE